MAKTSDIRHRLEQYKLLKASAKSKPSTSRPGDVVRYRPLLGVIEEDMQRRKRGRSSFEPSPGPQPPVQPIHDITEEDTELMPSPHPSENPTVTPIATLVWFATHLPATRIWTRFFRTSLLTRPRVSIFFPATPWYGCLMRLSP